MTFLIFFLTLAGINARQTASDSPIQPVIKVTPKSINIENTVKIRCETQNGKLCHFYTHHSTDPFRSEPNKAGVCQITVNGWDILEQRLMNSNLTNEVSVSCAGELMEGNQTVTSSKSEPEKLEVIGMFRKPRINVHEEIFTERSQVKIRCEAERGIHCHFYVNQNNESMVPLVKEPFKKEFKVCIATMFGSELLERRGNGNSTEVILSCTVEFQGKEKTFISPPSEKRIIKVGGLNESEWPIAESKTASSTDGQSNFSNTFIWTLSGGLLFLVFFIATGLILICLKHRKIQYDCERNKQTEENNTELYSAVNENDQKISKLHDTGSEMYYSKVKRYKQPAKADQLAQLHPKEEYCTVGIQFDSNPTTTSDNICSIYGTIDN
ncbi:uncharacterized protein [Lepisosteus oculatus]|uniref:uncharacterized protein isoform X3 n=1 Tax=Lepisosteus oculatus TaxID=7918 RepID=UPI0035F5281E